MQRRKNIERKERRRNKRNEKYLLPLRSYIGKKDEVVDTLPCHWVAVSVSICEPERTKAEELTEEFEALLMWESEEYCIYSDHEKTGKKDPRVKFKYGFTEEQKRGLFDDTKAFLFVPEGVGRGTKYEICEYLLYTPHNYKDMAKHHNDKTKERFSMPSHYKTFAMVILNVMKTQHHHLHGVPKGCVRALLKIIDWRGLTVFNNNLGELQSAIFEIYHSREGLPQVRVPFECEYMPHKRGIALDFG
jgi:hypothetical protein